MVVLKHIDYLNESFYNISLWVYNLFSFYNAHYEGGNSNGGKKLTTNNIQNINTQ